MTTKRKQVLATIIASADGAPPLSIAADLPFTDMGAAYSGRVVASGGAGSYSYSVTAKPAWMTATQVGQVLELTGTAGAPGYLTVTVTDALLDSATRTFYADTGGTIRPPKDPGYLPARPSGPILHRRHNGSNKAFSVQELLNAPTLPLTWGSPVGTLPPGMTWNAISGALVSFFGTSVAGEYLWSVPVTDAAGQSTTISIKIVVDDAITLTADLPDAILGQPYAGRITAIGGAEPITITLSSGALPPGMQLLPDGTFDSKAVPTAASAPDAASTFEVVATDALGAQSPPFACELRVTSGMPSIGTGRFLFSSPTAVVGLDFFAQIFGDGSDGSAVLDGSNEVAWATRIGSVYRMARDAYLHDLTIEPGCRLETNGYRIFGTGCLGLDGCGEGTIVDWPAANKLGANGTNTGSTAAGGTALINAFGTVGSATYGGNGGVGATSGSGAAPGAGAGAIPSNGGSGGGGSSGGAGGNGTSTNGSNGGVSGTASTNTDIRTALQLMLRGASLIEGGCGGGGGGYGGNNGATRGGGGGGGGGGGAVVYIAFRMIRTSSTTAAGCINADGGAGGDGCSVLLNNIGGGGGGAGGGGGYVHIIFGERVYTSGGAIAALVRANGGLGGAAGQNATNPSRSGHAGPDGAGGNIKAIDVYQSIVHSESGMAGGGTRICEMTL